MFMLGIFFRAHKTLFLSHFNIFLKYAVKIPSVLRLLNNIQLTASRIIDK